MSVTLTRINRTVLATGPGGGDLPPQVRSHLIEALTYHSRAYVRDFETGGRYAFNEERMYALDPGGAGIVFPLGMLPRITKSLEAAGVPVRHVGKSLIELNPEVHTPDVPGLLSTFEIYPGQDDCLCAIVGADGGMVTAPTGAGKSVLIRMLCRLYPKATIHIVTKAVSLATEIFEDVASVVPNVGMFGGGQKKRGRVTVFVAGSLQHGLGKSDILLIDELHEMVAPDYARKIGAYRTARVFGFTASPKGRHDGRDVEMEAMCGPVLYTMTYQEAQAMGRVVPINVEWLRVETGPAVGGLDPVTRDRVGIWQNDYRNRLIAARARRTAPAEQTLIMVKTIDHIVRLKALLPEYTIAYGADGMDQDRIDGYVDAGILPGREEPMTGKRLLEIRKQFASGALTKVISNYVFSTGVNFKRLAVLIRGDGAGSELRDVQIPGRASRPVPGVKDAATIVDCWDEFDNTLLDRARGRRRNYKSRGWSETFLRDGTPAPT